MWDLVTLRGPGNLKWVWEAVSKFIVPDWGDKVNSGIGCHTGPQATYCRLVVGRYVNFIPQPGTMNLATDRDLGI
jgi:hypothetical protein